MGYFQLFQKIFFTASTGPGVWHFPKKNFFTALSNLGIKNIDASTMMGALDVLEKLEGAQDLLVSQ
jgi:flagellin-like hook-associated protein FlgL